MREICTSGSEGGVAQTNAPSLPLISNFPTPTSMKIAASLLLAGLALTAVSPLPAQENNGAKKETAAPKEPAKPAAPAPSAEDLEAAFVQTLAGVFPVAPAQAELDESFYVDSVLKF